MHLRSLSLVLLTLALAAIDVEGQIIRRELSNWYLSSGNIKPVEARSPCYVSQVALRNGWIENPMTGSNEKACGWLFRQGWVFTHDLQIDASLMAHENLELLFEGLDTHVDVILNGDTILHADNMFRSWRVNVKEKVRAGSNTLVLHFHPALTHDSLAMADYPFALPDQRAFSRKAPYSYGWDWGPSLPDAGIWKPVYLEAWSGVRIHKAWVNTLHANRRDALCELRINLRGKPLRGLSAELTDDEGGLLFAGPVEMFESEWRILQISRSSSEFPVKQPRLWQPRGEGRAELYRCNLKLIDSNGKLIEEQKLQFGIRTTELDTSADASGNRFALVINGKPVFAKGANYVPITSFPSENYEAKLRSLLISAADANFNMLRVWGGGYYESDLFYDLCDSLGLMVWQDFMFACTVYPGRGDFLANVSAEAYEQVRRLASHPSIVLWCGNNEVKNGWEDWGWQQQFNWLDHERDEIEAGQDHIFNDLLPSAVKRYSPLTPYWPSSPLWGWGHPEHLKEGDSHHWGVWWGEQPISTFNKEIPRFMSEYGMQAYTTLAVLPLMNSRNPMNIFSPETQNHQKHPRGHQLINHYMMQEFGIVPKDSLQYIYMSQLVQAKTLETAILAHRQAEPYCMGTLYWQLNDCWPSISWASIDHSGSWKAAHYFVKRLYGGDWQIFSQSSLANRFGDPGIEAPKAIKIKVLEPDSLGRQRLRVSARGQALCIGLMPEAAGYFDDNFFDLAAGESRILTWTPLDENRLSSKIKVLTINDILYEKTK